MAKHLKPRDISAIVELIRSWTRTKLTWRLLCEAIAPLIQAVTTRQTLNSHPEIKAAYAAKKKGLRIHGPRIAVPSSLAVAAQRVARLQNTVDEQKDVISRLNEDRRKWQYNAYKHGITEEQLNEDLPRIDRERTDGKTSTELGHDGKARRPRGRRGKCQSV
jgi:hypothetical protein